MILSFPCIIYCVLHGPVQYLHYHCPVRDPGANDIKFFSFQLAMSLWMSLTRTGNSPAVRVSSRFCCLCAMSGSSGVPGDMCTYASCDLHSRLYILPGFCGPMPRPINSPGLFAVLF